MIIFVARKVGSPCFLVDCLGRRFFGCDINPEYVEMALKRLAEDRQRRAQLEIPI